VDEMIVEEKEVPEGILNRDHSMVLDEWDTVV